MMKVPAKFRTFIHTGTIYVSNKSSCVTFLQSSGTSKIYTANLLAVEEMATNQFDFTLGWIY